MSDYFLGEIRMFSIGWPPDGWAICDGSVMKIQSNPGLYSLLGTAFGGDGVTTFILPDLRGRTPVCMSTQDALYQRGMAGGAEGVALTATQIPQHSHDFQVLTADGAFPLPAGNLISSEGGTLKPNLYGPVTAPVALNPGSISPGAAAATHGNVQPSLVVNYCIALVGIYPPRN